MKTKKLLSFILTLTMVLSLVPAFTVSAFAGGTEHVHCVCGDAACKGGDGHDKTTVWQATDTLPTAAGYWYLTSDVGITETWSPVSGVVLCLNGHTVQKTNGGDLIDLAAGVNFTVTDCQDTVHNYEVIDGGSYSWILTDKTATVKYEDLTSRPEVGTVIAVKGGALAGIAKGSRGMRTHGATFTLYNGNIIGFLDGYNGGGIRSESSADVFNFYGGRLLANYSWQGGGGIMTVGTINLTGTEICFNTARHGGGINYNHGGYSYFTMTGGKIAFNWATGIRREENPQIGRGGGVYCGSRAKFLGGTIAENAAEEGGGISVATNQTILGNVSIANNKDDMGFESNIFLCYANEKIHIAGFDESVDPKRTFSISLDSAYPVTENDPWIVTTGSDNSYLSNIVSDNCLYEVSEVKNDGKNVVRLGLHDYVYTTTGAAINAKCGGVGCTLEDSLTITTSAAIVYNGQPQGPGFLDGKNYVGNFKDLDINSFTYTLADGTPTSTANSGAAEAGGAPVNAGTYIASLTCKGATAKVQFTIAKRTWTTAPTVSMESFAHGKYVDSLFAPSTSTDVVGDAVVYYYNTVNTTTAGAIQWNPKNANTIASNQYYMYAEFKASENMEGYETAYVPFSVLHEHTFTYTLTDNDTKIKCTCTSEPASCGDYHEFSVTVTDAEYTGKPYVSDSVQKLVKAIADVDGSTVKITYKDTKGNVLTDVPVRVGEYKAVVSVGKISTKDISFKITKKVIALPASDPEYLKLDYNGRTQTYNKFAATDGYQIRYGKLGAKEPGVYDVVVELKSKDNTQWSNGKTDDLVYAKKFEIAAPKVKKPTASTTKYCYNGGYQIYGYEDGALDYYSKDYYVTNYYRVDVGSQEVKVNLRDGRTWEDGSTAPLTFTLTVEPLEIPVPVADPRTFYAGYDNTWYPFYVIGGDYYCYEGLFYETTNNKRSTGGSQTVSVKPMANFVWEDTKTNAAKTFNFKVETPSAYGQIYCLIDTENGNEYTDGYIYGSYLEDATNSSNLYVKTHYKPYILTSPSNATYDLYWTYDPNKLDRSKKWNDLKYSDIKMGDLRAEYRLFYIYAVVHAPGRADYVTSPCPCYVYKAVMSVSSNKTETYTVQEAQSKSYGKSIKKTTYKDVQKTRQVTVKLRSFARLDRAGNYMIRELNRGASTVDWVMIADRKMAVFKNTAEDKKNIVECFGAASTTLAATKMTRRTLSSAAIPYGPTVQSNGIPQKLELDQDLIAKFEPNYVAEEYKLVGEKIGTRPFAGDVVAANDGNTTLLKDLPQNTYGQTCKVTFNSQLAEVDSDETITKTYTMYKGYTLDYWFGNYTPELVFGSSLPDDDGRTFVGWKYVPYTNGSTVKASTDGVAWNNEDYPVTDDLTLYAVWEFEGGNGEEQEQTSTGGGRPANYNVYYYDDVQESDYFYDAVQWASKYGITRGKTPSRFAPKDSCTRAEFVSFLWRAAGCPEVDYEIPFKDVTGDHYYTEAVRWAASVGIVKGITETTFAPNAVINRAQAVTYLARYAGVKDDASGYTNKFNDVASGSYYENSVAWAAENKITSGKTTDAFGPSDSCQRAHVVVFLYNYFINK